MASGVTGVCDIENSCFMYHTALTEVDVVNVVRAHTTELCDLETMPCEIR